MSEQIRQEIRQFRTVQFQCAGPAGNWIVEIHRHDFLSLVPTRAALPKVAGTREWHLHHSDDPARPLRITLQPPGLSALAFGSATLRGPLGLRFQELDQTEKKIEVELLQGEIIVPIDQDLAQQALFAPISNVPNETTEYSESGAAGGVYRWPDHCARLWPLSRVLRSSGKLVGLDDLTKMAVCLRIEPTGLYVQGRMPRAFYPPALCQKGCPSVVLRTPRQGEKTPTWVLSNFEFTPAPAAAGALPLLSAKPCVDEYLKSFAQFALAAAPEEQSLRSFVQGVESLRDDSCSLTLVERKTADGADGFDLEARGLGASIVLGGGSGPSAAFTPQRLQGRLDLLSNVADATEIGGTSWGIPFLWLDSERPGASMRAQPETPDLGESSAPLLELLRLSLTTRDPATPVRFDFSGTLTALSIPNTVVPGETLEASQRQAWLCLNKGWLVLGLPSGEQPALDARLKQPGAMSGALDIGRLSRDLGGAEPWGGNGLQFLAETVADTVVHMRATFAAKVPWQPDGLQLHLHRPMVTVKTPPVWLRELPAGSRPGVPPSLAAGYLWLAEGAAQSAESPEKILPPELWSWRSLFGSSVLVSSRLFAPADRPSAIKPFKMGAKLSGTGTLTLTLEPTNAAPLLWHLPKNHPIAQSFPLVASRNQGLLCEDTRGLLPYELRDATLLPELHFGRLFPSLVDRHLPAAPEVSASALSGIWKLSAAHAPRHYFLPTLPGVELEILPQGSREYRWQYRHAVPALDEAYTEVRERSEASDDAPPISAELTRAQGAVAFVFPEGAAAKTTATGWLPPSAANAKGAVDIQLEQVELFGPAPRFDLKLLQPGHEQTMTLGRDAPMLHDLPLQVTAQAADEPFLPRLDVRLAAEPTPYTLRRHGQPLITSKTPKSERSQIVTLDGEGRLQEEPIGPFANHQSVVEATAVARGTLSGSYSIDNAGDLETALHLELLEVQLAWQRETQQWILSSRASASSQISLHDGQHGWPRLFGFPVYLRRLVSLTRKDDGALEIVLGVIWLPCQPADAAGYDNAGAEIILKLRGAEGPALALHALEGKLDWRFPLPAAAESRARMVRITGTLSAQFVEAVAQREVSVQIDALTLDLGVRHDDLMLELLTLDLAKSQTAKLQRAPQSSQWRLALPKISVYTQAALRVHNLDISSIDAPAAPGPFTQTAPAADGQFAFWLDAKISPPQGAGTSTDGFRAELSYQTPQNDWQLTLLSVLKEAGSTTLAADRVMFKLALVAEPIADRRLLLHSRKESSSSTSKVGSWFETFRDDIGFATVAFLSPDRIKSLAAEVRLSLKGASGSCCGEESRLLAHLRLEFAKDQPSKFIEVWLTGALELNNGIRFLDYSGTADAVKHSATVFLDRALLPLPALPALFLGEGPADDLLLGAVVEHRLKFEAGTATFQCPQLLRLTTRQRYGQIFLEEQSTKEKEPQALVVDLGAALLLKPRADSSPPVLPASQGATPDIVCPGLCALTLTARRLAFVQPGEAWVVRLPMAVGIEEGRAQIKLTNPFTTGPLLRYPSVGVQAGMLSLHDPDGEAYERMAAFAGRSPLAGWLSANALYQALGPQAGHAAEPWLSPAFVVPVGNKDTIGVRLPDELGDLEWLRSATNKGSLDLSAALLVRVQLKDQPSPGVTLFEHPFLVAVAKTLDASLDADVDLQVVCATPGRLQRVTHQRLSVKKQPQDQDDFLRRWALALLHERRRGEPAILVRNYLQNAGDLLLLLRLDVAQRVDLPRARPWRTEYGPAVSPLAENVRPIDGGGDALRADAQLRGVLFSASPMPPAKEERTPSATLLRFAPTGGDEGRPDFAAYHGRLRPARAQRLPKRDTQSSFALWAYRKRDEVTFEAQAGNYPRVRQGTFQDLPRPELSVQSSRHEQYSILPPLIDLVAWSPRPGEMMCTEVGLLSYGVTPKGPPFTATGPAQRLTLRRPRALAGRAEQAELLQVKASRFLDQRIAFHDFKLTQVLATSPVPAEQGASVSMFVTTREQRHPGAAMDAIAEPALFFVPAQPAENSQNAVLREHERELERTAPVLWLVADDRYDPTKPSPNSTGTSRSMIILWRGDGPPTPDEVVNRKGVYVVKESLPPPGQDWLTLRSGDSPIYALQVSLREQLIQAHDEAKDPQRINVGLVTFSEGPPAAVSVRSVVRVACLSQASAIVAPKLVLALMARDPDDISLVGYRRLSPDDFTPLGPQLPAEMPSTIRWARRADVQLVCRAFEGSAPRTFDAMLFGPGGESIIARFIP